MSTSGADRLRGLLSRCPRSCRAFWDKQLRLPGRYADLHALSGYEVRVARHDTPRWVGAELQGEVLPPGQLEDRP